jgi:hypothetical protein
MGAAHSVGRDSGDGLGSISEAELTHAEIVKRSIVYQTDPRLTKAMNRWGCRVRCLMAIPEFVIGRALTAEQINDIAQRGRFTSDVIIDDEMTAGAAEHWLIVEAFRALGSNRRGAQVGWNADHLTSRPWEYMIANWKTTGVDGHFTLFDRLQREIFDPHNAEQAGYVVKKQRITRRLLYRTWAL